MKLNLEFHPVLFAIAPALLLVSNNPGQAFLSDTLAPIGVTLFCVIFLWIALSCLFKDRKKVAIIISFFLLVFFSFGHIHVLLRYYFVSPLLGELVRPRYLLLFFACFITLTSYLIIKTDKNLSQWTAFLNSMSIALIVIPLIQVANFSLQETSAHNKFNEMNQKEVTRNESEEQKVFPDIYYIILDGYARQDTLKEHLNFNNSEMIGYLEEKGFYVASKSRSNYSHTVVSLPSSLNMRYINHLTKIAGYDSSDPYYGWKMVEDNKVIRILKQKGYKVINFGSGWLPTQNLKAADLNIHCTHKKEFNSIFIQTTMYHAFEKYLHLVSDDRKHLLCTFSKIAEYGKIPGPKFIFAHMLIPHEPYVFGPDGETVPVDETTDREMLRKRYLGQLTFANKKVRELLAQILPKSPPFPIIIFQSDHGAKEDVIPLEIYARERLKIFNAYFLPGQGKELLYDSISPVNTFRLIFSHYFNEKYDLLQDQSFYSSAYSRLYDFKKLNLGENLAGAQP